MTQQDGFVGIDVAKAYLDIEFWPQKETLRVTNDRPGRARLIAWLKKRPVAAIGLEASGGYERDTLYALLDAGLPAHRLNPFKVRKFALACGINAKNDRLDAHVIARFVATIPQRPAVRNPAAEALAELVTARRQLCDEQTRASNQAGHAAQPVVVRIAKQRLKRLKAEILLLDNAIAKAVEADRAIAHKNELLRSVPGVGPVFAHTLLALMPELGNLSNRQAASLLGVAPFDCESGSFRGQRRIFGGRKPIRDVAYMAAIVAGQHNPVFAAFRKRLSDAGKQPKVVIVAMMRKLITTLNTILHTGEMWNENYKSSAA
jgi:transposase